MDLDMAAWLLRRSLNLSSISEAGNHHMGDDI